MTNVLEIHDVTCIYFMYFQKNYTFTSKKLYIYFQKNYIKN